MEPAETELARYFARLEEMPLEDAAAERLTLTETAQRILEAEFHRRGLTMPPATPLPAEPEIHYQAWVTIERFRDLPAAMVARSALEAADIPCILWDENTVRMDWQISNVIGGMRLQVHPQDFEAASAALAEPAIDATFGETLEGDLDAENCPHCGSDNVHREFRFGWISIAAVLLLGIPAPQGRRRWTCNACAGHWIENGRK